MLVGHYDHHMDAKNRVIVPFKLREIEGGEMLTNAFYLTKGPEGCVFAYTVSAWRRIIEERLGRSALPSRRMRELQRGFAGSAHYCTCDKQGRVVLPQELVDYAGLGREVTWIGAADRAEIWDSKGWREYEEERAASFADLFDSLADSDETDGFPGGAAETGKGESPGT